MFHTRGTLPGGRAPITTRPASGGRLDHECLDVGLNVLVVLRAVIADLNALPARHLYPGRGRLPGQARISRRGRPVFFFHRKPHPVIGVPSGATITVAVELVKTPVPLVPESVEGGIAGTVLSIVC